METGMIKSVEFRNFKALREANLPLERLTLLIGPNGSGKSTAIQAILAALHSWYSFKDVATTGLRGTETVRVALGLAEPFEEVVRETQWNSITTTAGLRKVSGPSLANDVSESIERRLRTARCYALDPALIAAPVPLQQEARLGDAGAGLAAVLDRLRDTEPERFEALNEELSRWLPEFDRFLFHVPADGRRGFMLRTRSGHYSIPAKDLSHGTLLALAIMTLAYLPDPPSLLCLEEPDRGIHPRLLREIQDALYRLSYPESYGEKRESVQVLVTTHSPYLLDLYRDHPERVVVSQKIGNEARFERLSDQPHIEEMLEGASLGEIWYSGILGGVPCEH